MKNLQDLFEHQMKDLYSAESQLIEALPKMIKNTTDAKLKSSFEHHLEETKTQRDRIVAICDELDMKPGGHKCKAMEGLIKEAEGFIKEAGSDEIMDVGLIAEAQRIEHYEISGYGTAVRYAKELGHTKFESKLQKSLDEEYNADTSLSKLAENRLNEKAKA